MGSMLCRDHKCSNGIRHSPKTTNPLKMNLTLEDIQLQKRITMWRKCEPLCGQTVDSARMITSELNLNNTTVHQILTQELAMRKLCAKIFLKNLTIEQKDNWKDMCLHPLERTQSDRNFLKCVITGDETWIFSMIQKQKDKVRNGTHLHHDVQKKGE